VSTRAGQQGSQESLTDAREKNNKKALGETQTLRAGHSNAEPKFFRPAADPFPGMQDRQNLIS